MKLKRIARTSIALARADLKLNHQESFLGIFWYLLSPLFLFALLYFIFSNSLGGEINQYALYLFLGVNMFNYFSQVTTEATQILKINRRLIKSINFPYVSLVIALVLKLLISFLISMILFFLLAVFNVGLSFYMILFIPVLFLFFLLVLGISMILSTLSVYIPDISHIWTFIVRALLFITPIFYISGNSLLIKILNVFNPLYHFIEASRAFLVYEIIPDKIILYGISIWAFVFFILGILFFNLSKKKITEEI